MNNILWNKRAIWAVSRSRRIVAQAQHLYFMVRYSLNQQQHQYPSPNTMIDDEEEQKLSLIHI